MEKSKFTFIDLFSGIGGFRMALKNNGGECLHFSEISKDAIDTYCKNSNEPIEKNLGDITKIKELPKHNLLTAGVPCQSWSIAGRNLGFDDDRGQLWNDTVFLLNQSRPDAFIFENVKGLVDPRNKKALNYILERINEAGYFANYYVLNSFDYGVPQNRIRIYIIGFKDKDFADKFKLPKPLDKKIKLADILTDFNEKIIETERELPKDLFGEIITQKSMSLSTSNGLNDYFLFNDLRNGHSTIHSWDILDTTERQKKICYLLLKNRRKSAYGDLDGNPLSIKHFQDLDKTITEAELDALVDIDILKKISYSYSINRNQIADLTEEENIVINNCDADILEVDKLKMNRELKLKKISLSKILPMLIDKEIITSNEVRYDFKNTKISTGLYGINRIFLPTSNIFPTLVASDTNDYVTTKIINAKNEEEHKNLFINKVYKKENYRRITKEEACMIQGFPKDYILPENRARWMKLIGNSVSVPVIEILGKAIIDTGVFDKSKSISNTTKIRTLPTNLYSEQSTTNKGLTKASL
ncbi:MAG: DNA (cytosine-5-)-methyltransferase [Flavobacteriales bacterium]|nr:DNA (cytosine-5-)-methyltransferase [Flavobacteriales bacterium]PJC62395.1 MAG: DNA (cytosine-5-)-methyltransferase [Flavobacteriales bacterium CG_4_9_14_0_2_um_filter_32_27]